MVITLAAPGRDEGGDRSSWLTDRSLVPDPWERRSGVVERSNAAAPKLGIAGTEATWAAIEGSRVATEASMRWTHGYLGWPTSSHSPSLTRSSCERTTTISRTHRVEGGSRKGPGPGTVASMGTDRRLLVAGSKLRDPRIEANKLQLGVDRRGRASDQLHLRRGSSRGRRRWRRTRGIAMASGR
jgi:hypothetical protein